MSHFIAVHFLYDVDGYNKQNDEDNTSEYTKDNEEDIGAWIFLIPEGEGNGWVITVPECDGDIFAIGADGDRILGISFIDLISASIEDVIHPSSMLISWLFELDEIHDIGWRGLIEESEFVFRAWDFKGDVIFWVTVWK